MNRSLLRRRLAITLLVTTLFLFAGLFATWAIAGALIAPSPREIGDAPADLAATPIALDSASGSTIRGWHTQGTAGNGVVVLLHGIRGNRVVMVERARWLAKLGYSTVLIDLQAHGESPGKHITVGYLEKHDVRAAVDFARHEHPDEAIGVLGMSLGGAAALLASPLGIDALVLESVYPDIGQAIHNRVTARLGPFAAIPTALLRLQLKPRLGISPEELRPIDHIAAASCPLFVISGTRDIHTTAAETEALFARAVDPKRLWLVEGAAHVDMINFAPEDYRERVAAFFAEFLQPAPSALDET